MRSVDAAAQCVTVDCLLLLQELSKQIEGHTICALGDGAAWPVQVSTANERDIPAWTRL